MHWSLVLAWVATVAAAAQTDLQPELLTLARIKTAMANTLARQPNYTCVQQIERSHRRLPNRRFELHDMLRLEVALVDGREMFAWPGARKFDQTDLTEMIPSGAIGTGDFAMHARAVFETIAPVFTYAGPGQLRGHDTLRFDFVVKQLTSGYHIKSPGHEAVVGYHGSLWADMKTHDLVRLEINADNIPPDLGISAARDVMDYDRMKIGSSEFLLPSASELSMVDLAGNESRNRTQFKSCRQYTGESLLIFDGAPSDQVAPSSPALEPQNSTLDLPADTLLNVRLSTAIDSTSAAVGDPIEAVLEERLRLKRRVLLDKGTKLLGRILRLERHGDFTTLDLQFSEARNETSRSTVLARLEEVLMPVPYMQMRVGTASYPRPPRDGIQIRGRIHLLPGAHLRLRTLAARK